MARIMSLNYSRQGKPRRLWRLAVATQPTIAENWYKVTYYRCVSIPSGRVFKILIILTSNLSPKYPPN